MVDFFTVPPVFVSVYLNRSWLGKSLLPPPSQSVLIRHDKAFAAPATRLGEDKKEWW